MKVLIVLSGGMDSTTALYWAQSRHEVVGAVTFNYGSKHNKKEIKAAAKLCVEWNLDHRVIKLPFVNEHFKSDLLKSGGDIPEGHYADKSMKRTVVPFRNGIMLAIAVGLAESLDCDAVVIGNHFGDHAIYPDCRQKFINAFSDSAKQGTYKKVKILSPFCKKTKTDIAKIGTKLGVRFENTWSCYKGGAVHCGRCGTCVERREAFSDSNIKDPTKYEAFYDQDYE